MSTLDYRCSQKHLYKYVTLDTLEQVLSSRSFKLTPPKEFNDLFDMQCGWRAGFTRERAKELCRESLSELYASDEPVAIDPNNWGSVVAWGARTLSQHLSLAEFLEKMEPAVLAGVDNHFKSEEDATAFWDGELDGYRVFCMTESHDNHAMWAHYADQNRGAVIKIRLLNEIDAALTVSRPCSYRAEPPKLFTEEQFKDFFKGKYVINREKFYFDLLLTKRSEWSYEREWRLVVPDKDFNFYQLHEDEISKIYFGYRASDEEIARCEHLAHEHFPTAKLFKASRSLGSPILEFHKLGGMGSN